MSIFYNKHMLFVFFNRYPIDVAKPGNSSIVYASPGEMIADWSNILVNIRVSIFSDTHFPLYFGGDSWNQTSVFAFAEQRLNHSPISP